MTEPPETKPFPTEPAAPPPLETGEQVAVLLAAQMRGTHELAVSLVNRMLERPSSYEVESARGGLAVKLMNLFAIQAGTLARLRGEDRRGEQPAHDGGEVAARP